MKQTTGCLKKTGFLDMTKKRTLVGIFKGVGLNSLVGDGISFL